MSGADVIVVDQYCGGGGSTTGLKRAAEKRGLRVWCVAINHSKVAIETHQRNHPGVRHIREDLAKVAPRDAVPGGRADILVSSPSCVDFSSAKGGKPVNDQERMGPYQITEWCYELDVRTVFVENVPEIRQWGPLCTKRKGHGGSCLHVDADVVPACPAATEEQREKHDGHDWRAHACARCGATEPCDKRVPERKSEYFRQWLREFRNLGYRYEYRIVNAADHGGATSRRRFFLKARKDGLPIPWAQPTHAPRRKAAAIGLAPWRAAREVLDLCDRGTSMLGRAKPLSPNTRLRIARGLLEFCGPLGPLFVDLLDLTPEDLAKLPRHLLARPIGPFVVANRMHNAPRSVDDEPLPTFTTAHGGGALVVQPFLLAQASGGVARSTDDPIPTIPTTGAHSVVQPFLVAQRDSWDGHQHVPGRARGVDDDPLQTITTDPGISLVQPHLDVFYGTGQPDSVDDPLSTLTTKARHGLVTPLVVPYGPTADARSVDEPLPTILTKDRLAVAQPMVVPYHNPGASGVPHTAKPVDEPLGTITTEPRFGLATPMVEPFVVSRMSLPALRSVDEPLHTVTGSGLGSLATPALEPFIVPNFGEREGQHPRVHPTTEPLPTVTSRGAGNLIQPDLEAAEDAGVDPRRLVWIDGRLYVLNLFYRMLRVRELARGMGFDDDYWFAGGTRDATKMIGNAVETHVAEAELGVILDSLFPAALAESVA